MPKRYASASSIRPRPCTSCSTRLTFNILVGNVDDHARNHAAFWDGAQLALTPAYDICPQARAGQEASQAMLIVGRHRSSQIATCLAAAGEFHMTSDQAIAIVSRQIETIGVHWLALCDKADLGPVDRALFWGRQFLNPFAFYELEGPAAVLAERAATIRGQV
ncbi:MAG: HipA domain-containing protein [Sphingomonas taxi]